MVREHAWFAAIGWLAGVGTTLLMALVIAPAMVTARPVRTLEDALLLGLIILIASPAALVGGIVGGRMLREGGAFEQRVLAALIGGILSMPLSCVAIWQIGW